MKKSTKILLLSLFLFNVTIFSSPKPYVILISFDAFRWDYLNRGISPNLEKVKETGVSALSLRPVFPSKTFPNHISIITGMYPPHHGIISNNFYDAFSEGDSKWYKMKDTSTTQDPSWYLGEAFWETAERQGIKTASYFWPGNNLHSKYRRPTYVESYEYGRPNEPRIQQVIKWLQLPQTERPHFITLYFQDTDDAGHDYGPDSPEVNKAVKVLDSLAGLLFKRLNDINMRDSVNVIFVSDHGMTEISPDRVINVEKIVGKHKARFFDDGPFMIVQPENGDTLEVFNALKKNEKNYKVYMRDQLPSYFHYNDNPFIAPIILVADLGWSLVAGENTTWLEHSKGNHGYDNNQLDMQGIFLAEGPNFKQGYRTGTLWNIDIYPLLCKIFNIVPRANIDGKLERIGFILK